MLAAVSRVDTTFRHTRRQALLNEHGGSPFSSASLLSLLSRAGGFEGVGGSDSAASSSGSESSVLSREAYRKPMREATIG